MNFYIDLDGVLVDLQRGYEIETGYGLNDVWNIWKKDKERIWGAINNPKFWRNLPKTKDCDRILKTLEEVKDFVYILSSPIKKDKEECKNQKIQWVLNNTWIPKERIFIVNRVNKKDFSNSNSLLLDDYKDNIIQWEQQGGVGILHDESDINKTLNELKNIKKRNKKCQEISIKHQAGNQTQFQQSVVGCIQKQESC